MFNLLSSAVTVFSQVDASSIYALNFIGKFIKWLIESLPSMGLGIIVFTLFLKVITLPLDIYSRASMKKNNMKMERMRPQLERLQRQYQNNPQIYNQKIQALYKKEGYSALSSCLLTLVTLVVFIIVINQFSNYSSYANLTLVEKMVSSYNVAIETYNDTTGEDLIVEVVDAAGKKSYFINHLTAIPDGELSEKGVTRTVDSENAHEYIYEVVDVQKFGAFVKTLNDGGYTAVKVGEDILFDSESGSYSINVENFDLNKTDPNKFLAQKVFDHLIEDVKTTKVLSVARQASATAYRENVPSFLWVKNIWAEDLPWKHPVKENFEDYGFSIRKGCKSIPAEIGITEEEYQELTFNLSEEKSSANGYLILVVLSIGVMVLSQIIMNKTQKAQLELQSADGQAAQTSKMMTWLMPVMFGFFAFVYTASFSIYMVISSLLSTGSTLVINHFVEKSFNKKLAKEEAANDKRYKKTDKK